MDTKEISIKNRLQTIFPDCTEQEINNRVQRRVEVGGKETFYFAEQEILTCVSDSSGFSIESYPYTITKARWDGTT